MLDDFWLRPDPCVESLTQPQLTDAMVEETEAHLGVKLPAGYISLLRRLNGGLPRRNAHRFPDPDPAYGSYYSFDMIMGIPPHVSSQELLTVAGSRETALAWDLPETLVSITHSEVDCEMACLDYRRCGPFGDPSVAFVTVQPWGKGVPGERLNDGAGYLLPLAPDFGAFVNGLFYWNDDHEYGIVATESEFDRLTAHLDAALGTAAVRSEVVGLNGRNAVAHRTDKNCAGWEHQRWKSWLGAKYPARTTLFANIAGDEFLDHPDHPECAWILRSDIRKKRRCELEEILARLPYEVVTLHLPDLEAC